jgi:hypothetical protein
MSYHQITQGEQEILNDTEKRLYEKLRVCRLVEATLKTQGWQEIILPSLERMIVEELGGKLKDNWVYGKIQEANSTDNVWFHLGAKQRLMELHNHIYNYVKAIEKINGRLKQIEAERRGEFDRPMMEVQYAVSRKKEEEPKKEKVDGQLKTKAKVRKAKRKKKKV